MQDGAPASTWRCSTEAPPLRLVQRVAGAWPRSPRERRSSPGDDGWQERGGEIDARQADEAVHDSGDRIGRPKLLAEDLRYEVELRDCDESPVQRADNPKDERKGAESGVYGGRFLVTRLQVALETAQGTALRDSEHEKLAVSSGFAMELGGLEPPTSWVRSRRSPN